MAALEIKDLRKAYPKGNFTLLVDNLRVDKGSVFGLLGPNGAGKTSLLKLLMDMVRPDVGSITILGHNSYNRRELLAKIAYMPENKSLYPHITVRKMLDWAAALIPGWDKNRASELAELFPLEEKKKISTLSYGEKTQLYAILTFARSAELFILDEPGRGLDPLMQEQMLQLIKEASWQSKTVIFSSHQLGEIEASADDVAMLRNGHIVLNGNLDDLKSELFLLRIENSKLASVPESRLSVIATHNHQKYSSFLCQGGMESRQRLMADFSFLHPEKVNIKDIFLMLMGNGGEEK